MKYQHSVAFNDLKSIHEDIPDNLTSSQYLQTLDYFIYNAIDPIATDCYPFFINFVSKVVSNQIVHPSTKFSSEKENLPSLFVGLLNNKMSIKDLHINRGLLFSMITVHQQLTKGYVDIHSTFADQDNISKANKLRSIELSVGCKPNKLYSVITQVEHWDNKARWFKGLIAQKFTRLVLNQAQKTYKEFNCEVPLDDVSQIYLSILNKAIDRCDSRLGVLTTYIRNWMFTARSMVSRIAEQEISYDELTDSNLVNSSVMPNGNYEAIEHISYVAQRLDPEGLVRISLGIPQYMSRSNQLILESAANRRNR